jgi:hypothetical protein
MIHEKIRKNTLKLKHAKTTISFFRTMIYRGDMPSQGMILAEGIQ